MTSGWMTAAVLATTAGTASLVHAQSQAATLNYTVDAGLIYVDRIARPPSQGAIEPGTFAAASTPRTLGLDRMRLVMDWQTPRSASLRVVLRPDAANRALEPRFPEGGPARELDTRAGDDPYRPAPTVRVLDAYQITLNPGTSLTASAGVWEELARHTPAYPEVLGFGLGVAFPAKFDGARLRWENLPATAATAEPRGNEGLITDFYLMQGDEDRGETLGVKKGDNDLGPIAQDPYYGGALQLTWVTSPTLTLGSTFGYIDAADGSGRHNEVLAQATIATTIMTGTQPLTLGLDARYVNESWRAKGIDARSQQSAALTSAWHWTSRTAILLGVMQGRSDGRTGDDISGFGVESGVLRELGEGLHLQLMLSHEERTRSRPGQAKTGGFHDAFEGDRGVVRRMGLELSYLLNDNV